MPEITITLPIWLAKELAQYLRGRGLSEMADRVEEEIDFQRLAKVFKVPQDASGEPRSAEQPEVGHR